MAMRPAKPAAIVTEEDNQAVIVSALRMVGYTVLQTNLAKGRVIADKGVPDLLVTRATWPAGVWLGIEIKRPKGGRLSPEQRALLDAGRIYLVTDPQHAIYICRGYDAMFRGLVFDKERITNGH